MEAHTSMVNLPASLDRPDPAQRGGAGRALGRAGDTDMVRAFEELFVVHYPRVVGIAARVLADRAEAEDVAQEVFLAFHRSHSPVADYAAPWLYRAAWHTSLNRIRGRKRRERREVANDRQERVDAWAQDPSRIVERSYEREVVRRAMRKLPAKAAGVLALRYSGLSYAEVAEAMGMGIGQVGTVLRRAEARLKREVES
ncbi:MAG: RNA polymerase sigma factor [Actinomycetota bacterium]